MKKDKRMHDESKTLYHMDRVIEHFDKGERIAPVHIDAGIAKFCNVSCVFCYGDYQEKQNGVYIKKEPLFQMMKDAGEIGVRSVAIIGDGEPTCNPHFYKSLYVGKEAGLSLSTSTNGVLLNTKERRKAILENCEWMRFCLSAGTREGYNLIHRRDKFDNVKKNIEAIVNEKERGNYKIDIGLQSVFVPTLMGQEMVEEAKLAVNAGVDYFVIKQCSLPDEGQTGMMQFDLSDYDKPEVINGLKEAESYSNDRTDIIVKWGTMDLKGQRPYNGCPSIPLISDISGNGDWFPCGHMFGTKKQFEKYKFGNLHETTLKEMVRSNKYWDIIKDMRYNFDVHKDCKGACRQDAVNKFVYDYLDKPKGINFL